MMIFQHLFDIIIHPCTHLIHLSYKFIIHLSYSQSSFLFYAFTLSIISSSVTLNLSLSHSIAPTIDSSSEINFYILQTSLPYYILDSIRYSSVEKTNCHIHHLFHMPSMSIRDSSSQAYDRSSLLFAGLGVWDLTADKKQGLCISDLVTTFMSLSINCAYIF